MARSVRGRWLCYSDNRPWPVFGQDLKELTGCENWLSRILETTSIAICIYTIPRILLMLNQDRFSFYYLQQLFLLSDLKLQSGVRQLSLAYFKSLQVIEFFTIHCTIYINLEFIHYHNYLG